MNIGTARYWVLRPHPRHGWILVAPSQQEVWLPGCKTIDRGPINHWTGKPHRR